MLEYAILRQNKEKQVQENHPNWSDDLVNIYMKWWENRVLEKIIERDNLPYES